MAEPDRRVDQLREQLKALGYLDARLDRFVLAGAGNAARPLSLALTASARIGVLAGMFLGPSAAIGLRARASGLVTSVSDAIVLAVYLAVLFALATTVISAAGILIGALAVRGSATRAGFPRRARQAAGAAGLAVGLACLVYLTFWWQAAAGLTGSTSLVWSLAVLAIAVSISLLLGHAVTVTVLALLARSGLAQSLRPGLPLSSAKVTLPLGGVAFIGALVLLVATAPANRATAAAPALTIVPTNLRVVVVGIDGVEPGTMDRLRAAGRLPLFDRLLGQAVATLPADLNRDPARVWTTLATGQPPERHGVRTLESRQVAGLEGRLRAESPGWTTIAAATDLLRLTRPAIASGNERLIPAFWEVAARAGLRTAVVHWWATWPAAEDAGIVLSDRAILRLEHGGTLDGEIAPASLYDAIRQSWPDRRRRAVARAAGTIVPGVSEVVAAAVQRSAELDATLIDLATDANLGKPDLQVLYLPGLDIAQHALFSGTEERGLAPSAAAERVASLERYYAFLDDSLGQLLTAAPAESLVVLVTQPGRVVRPANGLLALSGPIAAPARSSAVAAMLAPTVLHALGVPVAADLAARPATALFAPAFLSAHPLRTVTTYGSRQIGVHAATGQPLDKEMIERMRSLGYVR